MKQLLSHAAEQARLVEPEEGGQDALFGISAVDLAAVGDVLFVDQALVPPDDGIHEGRLDADHDSDIFEGAESKGKIRLEELVRERRDDAPVDVCVRDVVLRKRLVGHKRLPERGLVGHLLLVVFDDAVLDVVVHLQVLVFGVELRERVDDGDNLGVENGEALDGRGAEIFVDEVRHGVAEAFACVGRLAVPVFEEAVQDGGWIQGLFGQNVDARKSVSMHGICKISLMIFLMPIPSRPFSVAMRSMRLAPNTYPVLPYSWVPQHHGMSCVPNMWYFPGPRDWAATQLKPPYAHIEPM